MDYAFAISFFGAFFAILNPASVLPIFLTITDGATIEQQRQVAVKVTCYALVMSAIVGFAGAQVLTFFGISVDDFRVAGGIIMFLMGLNMINGDDSTAHQGTDAEQNQFPGADSVSFYPMTFPMIIGPGSIAILILFAHQAQGMSGAIEYALVVVTVLAILGISLYLGPNISKHLTITARSIMNRLMGMLLAAMAVGMIAAGLTSLFPVLA